MSWLLPACNPPWQSRTLFQTDPLIRIVHLGKYYPPSPGGIEGHTQTLAHTQADAGASVRVIVVNHADGHGRDTTFERFTRTPDTEEADGAVGVIRVGRRANFAKLDIAPGLSSTLRRVLRDPPDIWHLHTPNPTMMLAVLADSRIRPLIVTHHSDIVRQRRLRRAFGPIERAVYRRAVRILATSEAYIAGSELLRRFADKVTVVPLGIDATPFREPNANAVAHAARFRAQFGSLLWLAVGRLISYKGLPVALEALKHVPGKLLVIGTGPLESELKRKADALGVGDRMIWHGSATQDELVGAYLAATALWFPSTARSEGFGLVQVEAMAAGCPVINTAIAGSGVRWVSRHEREGFTAPVGDAIAFAALANRMLDSGERERLASAGRIRAASEFDHRVMAERTLAIYRDAVR